MKQPRKVNPEKDPRVWTPDENAWLIIHWKPFDSKLEEANFRAAYKRLFGKTRTMKALEIQAHKLGVSRLDGAELPTLTEVARELGVKKDVLQGLCTRNPERYPTVKKGPYRLVPEETYLKLCERYRVFTQEDLALTMTVEEAADRLCYTTNGIRRLIAYNALTHLRRGQDYRVHRSSVEEAVQLRKLHGKDWLKPIAHRLSDYYHHTREPREGLTRSA